MQRPDMRLVIDAGAGAKEGMSRIGGISATPLVLEELGFDPTGVLSEVGVEARLFADPNNLIQDTHIGRVLRHGVARTGCENFALRVGQHARLSSLGLVGELARSSPDVGTALQVLSRFLSLNDGGAIISVSAQGAFGSFNYAIYEVGLEATCQIYQLVSAVACNALRDLCGPEWAPSEVLIPCGRPREVRPYRDFFRAPVRFDSDRMTVSFPRTWFNRPLHSADRALHAALSAQAAAFEAQAPPDLPSQVRRVMRRLLLEGKGSIEAVARAFAMHRRTLDRHLDACGLSFRTLADATRFEVACQLLSDTQMPVSKIAVSLHYGDASAFAHAFRRWSGSTPTQWRESAKGTRQGSGIGSRDRARDCDRSLFPTEF